MTVIKNLNALDKILTSQQLEQLDAAAMPHISQSNISFEIIILEGENVKIEVTQDKKSSGKYATEATLVKRAHEVFDRSLSSFSLEISTVTALPSPVSTVNTEWLEKKMLEKGIRIKQIAFDTGIDRESIADWVGGKRSMGQTVKAMFYFYFNR